MNFHLFIGNAKDSAAIVESASQNSATVAGVPVNVAERSPDNVSKEHQTAEKPVQAVELANTADMATVIGIFALIYK